MTNSKTLIRYPLASLAAANAIIRRARRMRPMAAGGSRIVELGSGVESSSGIDAKEEGKRTSAWTWEEPLPWIFNSVQ